jgi:hypothetical protein
LSTPKSNTPNPNSPRASHPTTPHPQSSSKSPKSIRYLKNATKRGPGTFHEPRSSVPTLGGATFALIAVPLGLLTPPRPGLRLALPKTEPLHHHATPSSPSLVCRCFFGKTS